MLQKHFRKCAKPGANFKNGELVRVYCGHNRLRRCFIRKEILPKRAIGHDAMGLQKRFNISGSHNAPLLMKNRSGNPKDAPLHIAGLPYSAKFHKHGYIAFTPPAQAFLFRIHK